MWLLLPSLLPPYLWNSAITSESVSSDGVIASVSPYCSVDVPACVAVPQQQISVFNEAHVLWQ